VEIKEYRINETLNGKYTIQLERSAVKGQDGFKVTVNSDNIEDAEREASRLYGWSSVLTRQSPTNSEVKVQ
jgi:hypothetical protein